MCRLCVVIVMNEVAMQTLTATTEDVYPNEWRQHSNAAVTCRAYVMSMKPT
jgi:ferredoxin